MQAIHFGAGNIGRGFIGAVLQDAGYHVIFADVNAELVAELNDAESYRVVELGTHGQTRTYKNFEAVNSAADRERLIALIAEADVITASVGANVLPRIAEVIAIGLDRRQRPDPVVVMACENAVNATDLLAKEVLKYHAVQTRAVFCNTAVDRIVPLQPTGLSPSVEVEAFCEWVIESKNLRGVALNIPAANLVEDLGPYIERKLFTVNTAHCSVAYLGQQAGYPTIASAMKDPEIVQQVRQILRETSTALIRRFGFDVKRHEAYVTKTLERLSSEVIDDQVERVGRQPLRKLSRSERLISPAAYLAEKGVPAPGLLRAISAALNFRSVDDPEVQELEQKLQSLSPGDFVAEVCGLTIDHPLFEQLVSVVSEHQASQRIS